MRKFIALITLVLIIAGCSKNADRETGRAQAAADSAAMHIAVMPNLECLPLMVAEEKGLFDSLGVDVALKLYPSHTDCDTAIAGRSVDAMMTDLIRGKLWEKEHKKELKYVTHTNAHYMLVSSKKARVKDLSHMVDKLMAVTRYSITDALADTAIMKAGSSEEEMFKVQIDNIDIRLEMLLNNKVEAAFLQHPYAAFAISKGGTVIMDCGRGNSGVLAFRSEIKSKAIDDVLKVYDMACDMINKKGVMHYADVVYKYTKKDIKKYAKQFKNIKFVKSSPVREGEEDAARRWVRSN